jgi:hypothetical protein
MIKGGFHGQVLRVDLSSGDIQTQPLDEAIALKFLGGRGYGAKILYDENPPGVDPYSPENRLVFFTSPLMGTKTPWSNFQFSPNSSGINRRKWLLGNIQGRPMFSSGQKKWVSSLRKTKLSRS